MGRKWLWFWQPLEQLWGCLRVLAAASTAQISPSRTWGFCWGGEGVTGQDSGSSLLLPCPAAVFVGLFPPGATRLVSHTFPFEGKPHNKNLLSQLFEAELSGHFTLWSLLLKLSLAAAALRIPVGAEVEAEHFWAGLGQRRLQHQELSLPEHTGTFCHL